MNLNFSCNISVWGSEYGTKTSNHRFIVIHFCPFLCDRRNPIFWWLFQQNPAPNPNVEIISNWFQLVPRLPDLNTRQNLWDVEDLDIRVVHVRRHVIATVDFQSHFESKLLSNSVSGNRRSAGTKEQLTHLTIQSVSCINHSWLTVWQKGFYRFWKNAKTSLNMWTPSRELLSLKPALIREITANQTSVANRNHSLRMSNTNWPA